MNETEGSTVQADQPMSPAHTPSSHGLVWKLAEVMAVTERVPKNGVNEHFGYRFATEADVLAAVRAALAERHVLVMPIIETVDFEPLQRRNGTEKLCTLKMRFDFVDGETGETLSLPMYGQGSDAGDKSIYKALSGATKYALMKLFLIPTGDDPEHEAAAAPANGSEPPRPMKFKRPEKRTEAPSTASPPEKPRSPAKDSPEARERFLLLLEQAKTGLDVVAAGKFAVTHLSKAVRDEFRAKWDAALARTTGPKEKR